VEVEPVAAAVLRVEVVARLIAEVRRVPSKRSIFKPHLVPAFGRWKLDEIALRDIEIRARARDLCTGLPLTLRSAAIPCPLPSWKPMADLAASSTLVVAGCQIEFWPRTQPPVSSV
jgi:hypothetical protein